MFAGPIPTGGGNSRLAALNARKRPTIDVNDMGIAIEAGGGRTPMLTNRVESLSDEGLRGVSQRGFSSGREAVGSALEATGRTFRTNAINDELTRAREQREMDYALQAEDEMAKAKSGNAVAALQARGKAETFFDPMVARAREADTAERMRLYGAQTAGSVAKAQADIEAAGLKAGADIEGARLGAGARALTSMDEIRAGLEPETPGKDGWLWDTPAVPNDQGRIDQIDERTIALIDSLGLNEDVGMPPADGTEATASPADQQRTQAITEFATRHNIQPQQAEQILLRRGIIQ